MHETSCKPASCVQTWCRIFQLPVSGMDAAYVNWLSRAADFMQLICLVPPGPKSRSTCLGTKVPFNFRHNGTKLYYYFLLYKVIFECKILEIHGQAGGTVFKGKAAAESGPSVVVW